VALALAAAGVAFAPLVAPKSTFAQKYGPKLGLDIRGGTRVVLEADTSKLPAGVAWNQDTRNAVVRIIENRVNANGVAESTVALKGQNQVVVELPEIQNDAQVLEQLQNTAQLQFFYSGDWVTQRNSVGRYEIRPVDGPDGREQFTITDRNTKETFRDPFHINRELSELLSAGAKAAATVRAAQQQPTTQVNAARPRWPNCRPPARCAPLPDRRPPSPCLRPTAKRSTG
jgi:preprotein translocase subunit SecD